MCSSCLGKCHLVKSVLAMCLFFEDSLGHLVILSAALSVIYSIFLTLGLAIKNILSARQNRELQSFMYMQKQQYDYQLQHVLRELVKQKEMEAAREYIDTIWNIQEEFDLKVHTGDRFLDVIVNYYLYLTEKEKIEFVVSGKLTGKLQLDIKFGLNL